MLHGSRHAMFTVRDVTGVMLGSAGECCICTTARMPLTLSMHMPTACIHHGSHVAFSITKCTFPSVHHELCISQSMQSNSSTLSASCICTRPLSQQLSNSTAAMTRMGVKRKSLLKPDYKYAMRCAKCTIVNDCIPASLYARGHCL